MVLRFSSSNPLSSRSVRKGGAYLEHSQDSIVHPLPSGLVLSVLGLEVCPWCTVGWRFLGMCHLTPLILQYDNILALVSDIDAMHTKELWDCHAGKNEDMVVLDPRWHQ